MSCCDGFERSTSHTATLCPSSEETDAHMWHGLSASVLICRGSFSGACLILRCLCGLILRCSVSVCMAELADLEIGIVDMSTRTRVMGNLELEKA